MHPAYSFFRPGASVARVFYNRGEPDGGFLAATDSPDKFTGEDVQVVDNLLNNCRDSLVQWKADATTHGNYTAAVEAEAAIRALNLFVLRVMPSVRKAVHVRRQQQEQLWKQVHSDDESGE